MMGYLFDLLTKEGVLLTGEKAAKVIIYCQESTFTVFNIGSVFEVYG